MTKSFTIIPINGELRIHDLEIGERLGFADPRMIRKLIKGNTEKLNKISVLYAERKPSGDQGGRPATEYYLTAAQAAFIVMNCETGLATNAKLALSSALTQSLDIIRAMESFDVPDDLPDMFVYAIREKDTGNIKLGISRDPKQRLKQLQTGNSSQLELVAYRKAENRYRDERAIHAAADAHRLHGEWFSSSVIGVMQ